MTKMDEIFGCKVFNDTIMRERLPKDIYKKVMMTKMEGKPLTKEVADVVANVMKDWALEKGVTHFTHWFQPMTGITAEKHDSFIAPAGNDKVIMEFSGKELIKGEPDASSFPSGGLRSTFEARGYTAWDPTSNAFIKDGILCIPTIFCSYTGEALDKKTPLMRSMETINTQALRILRLLGHDEVTRVTTSVGAEQEYFLIDRKMAAKRKDIVFAGRTLFGAAPPKGQELEDHYFGVIRPRVVAYMKELDEELWKLGILAKTKHNEAAPAQHELAPIYATTNIATDHNQLTMEIMKKVAERHGMKCLLHEKPFEGVNGSGKHNNWSLSTDTGINLLNPGKNPEQNIVFITFLCAVIKAVDEYQDLLRVSVATAGNDHRLGANEAPPAIISIFLGDDITEMLEAVENDSTYFIKKKSTMDIGVEALPNFTKDTTDRNRTSPFAFTGNKFEFRMPGSSLSVSGPNFILNTAVAEVLKEFADELEGKEEFDQVLHRLLQRTIKEHKRIIFNGNNYSDEWLIEAEKRGLLNLKSAPDALPTFVDEKNIRLFTEHGIFTRQEMYSRLEILLENYCKVLNIEALTMLEMARQDIAPAVVAYLNEISSEVAGKKAVFAGACCAYEEAMIEKLSRLLGDMYVVTEKLDEDLTQAHAIGDRTECAKFYRDVVFAGMNSLREIVDSMEVYTAKEYWPMPTYSDLLFSI